MRNQLFIGAAVAALIAPAAVQAQETTSVIRGTVTSGGAPVANATIVAVHVPSGTRSTATTDASGNFTLSGLRPGGPYTVSVNNNAAQVTDIYTVVAQPYELPIDLAATGQDIVVTASAVAGAGTVAQGPTTLLRAADVALVASANRDIRDLERRDPFARLDDTPTGGRAVSFAGQNARFNRFTVDGVPITDNFGLNQDGLPSRRSPIPFDAIGQFQAKVAPYDIREGNFQGGTINVILKSGTNDFQGTGFYARSGDEFQGNKTKNITINVPSYKIENYGVELSGPIVKDKIFFMIAGESLRGGQPLPEGPTDNNIGTPIPGLTQAQVNQIVSTAKSRYNYDAGGVLQNSGDKDDRIVGKIDINLSDKHRLALTGTYAQDKLNINSSNTFTTSPTGLSLSSNSYVSGNKLWTIVGQLNSQWTDEFSTEVRGFYKNYKRQQDPLLGRGFAQFKICVAPTSDRAGGLPTGTTESNGCQPGFATVSIGPDNSRQTNILHTETWGGLVQARLTRDDHDVRLFGEYTDVSTYDAFLQNSAGNYYFDSLADFAAGNAQTLTYGNAIPSLNPLDAAAIYGYQSYTAGIMDTWKVTPDLTVSYGARYDLYGTSDRPVLNTTFLTRYNFPNTYTIDGRGVFQPRLSIDFRPTSRLSINAGGGIFAGSTPDVYLVNSFQNTGVLSNSITIRQQNGGGFTGNAGTLPAGTGAAALTNVSGYTIPAAVNAYLASAAVSATSSVNALDPNFKIPSQWRATVSANYDADLGPLGDRWRLGADFLYSKVRDQVFFTDFRSVPIAGSLTPDGRQRYRPLTTTNGAPNFSDSGNDIFLTNTSKGRSYIAVARFDKSWDLGLNIFGSFTYEDVKDQTPATSSTASSNYNNAAFLDPNFAAYGISNDQVKYFFKYGLTYNHAFFGDYKTTISLFGETRIGHPYSYTFQDPSSGRSAVFGTTGAGTTGTSGSRYLLYVPMVGNDPKVSYESTAFQQAFESFITSTGLSQYQGKIAPRNAFHSPWFTRIDLHASQEIPTGLGKSRVTVFADIENFTNLLNKNWGQISEFAFPYNIPAVRVQCLATAQATPATTQTQPTGVAQNAGQACAQYRYSSVTGNGFVPPAQQVYVRQSLYTIRVGARFSF